jgi:hypothetical protein
MPEHVPNTVLFNKYLEPPNNTATVPDSRDGKLSGETLIAEGNGWDWAPLETEAGPGVAPEPVEYAPVTPAATDKADDDKGKAGKAESKSNAGKSGQAKES